MLLELQVRDLGVIEHARLGLGPGMTALTGETGAGKTLLVEALELLLGGRADPVLVRPGAAEAMVEARFALAAGDGDTGDTDTGERGTWDSGAWDTDTGELILARAVPAGGRSRAWINGRMALVSALAEAGGRLVDLHGQHTQQSLLDPAAQRRALDGFGAVDTGPLARLQAERRAVSARLGELGGDERARRREIELLEHQLHEIDRAGLEDPDEDRVLAAEEERLADATAYRQAVADALGALDAGVEGAPAPSAVDLIGSAAAALGGRPALERLGARVEALQAEVADAASELRSVLETWDDDPERLGAVRARRQQLRDLSRKYGEGVTGVLGFAQDARARLAELQSTAERARACQSRLGELDDAIAAQAAAVGALRRRAAPALGRAVEERLRTLAMPRARLEVTVGEPDPGDEVTFLLGANPGEPVQALTKVASGGELARAMLALRLVLSEAPPTVVFDEVDAGVGGEAALAVGRSLAELARRRQVLVVTHLAQVAAYADRQLVVRKEERNGRTVADVTPVSGRERVVELARMLSGSPGSDRARRHAEELLASAGAAELHP